MPRIPVPGSATVADITDEWSIVWLKDRNTPLKTMKRDVAKQLFASSYTGAGGVTIDAENRVSIDVDWFAPLTADQWFSHSTDLVSLASGEMWFVESFAGNVPTYENAILAGDYGLPVGFRLPASAFAESNFVDSGTKNTRAYAVGDVVYIHPDDEYSNNWLKATITAVDVGGTARLYKANFVASDTKPVDNGNNYWRFTTKKPRELLHLVAEEVTDPQNLVRGGDQEGPPSIGIVVLDGDTLRYWDVDEARAHLMGPETKALSLGDLALQDNVPDGADEVYIQQGAGNSTNRQINITWSSAEEEKHLKTFLRVGQRLSFGSYIASVIGSAPSFNSVASGGAQFAVRDLEGNVPGSAGDIATAILGTVVHWTDPETRMVPTGGAVGDVLERTGESDYQWAAPPNLYQVQGKRADLRGPKSASGDFVHFSLDFTPSSAAATLRVRISIHGRCQGNSNNNQRHSVAVGRWKVKTSSDYKGFLDSSDDFSVFGYRPTGNPDYGDWLIDHFTTEFDFSPNTTDEIQIDVGLRTNDQPGGNNWINDNKYFNRAINASPSDLAGNDDDLALQSFVEVTEVKAVDDMSATPIAVSNIANLST